MIVVEPVDQGGQKGNLTGRYQRIDGKHLKEGRVLMVVMPKDTTARPDLIRLAVRDPETVMETMGINMESGVQKTPDSTKTVMMRIRGGI